MPDMSIVHKKGASLTYIIDCANRLSKAYPSSSITIASATGSVDSPAVISAVSGTGTTATFHLATSSVTPPANVNLTITPILSNDDVDPLTIRVEVV